MGKDDKEQAKQDYARLLFCIKQIARRGLKVLVQLLMCAQCDYRDEDLQEALINVTSGMAFCLRVTAAQAAGFYQTELLQRNAREDKIGQAVVEMPDCKDLILAPANDLRARLKALGKAVQQDIDVSKSTRLAQPSEHRRAAATAGPTHTSRLHNTCREGHAPPGAIVTLAQAGRSPKQRYCPVVRRVTSGALGFPARNELPRPWTSAALERRQGP